MNPHTDLLESYLQAVGEHLPAASRADTLAELRANLLAEIEGREEALDRPLTEAELAAILEAHGMPVLVAARYGAQHYLIGPQLFPFYWYTLKRSFPYVVALYALVQVVTAIVQSSDGPQLGERIGAAVLHFPQVALLFWAIMTLGFVAFEFAQGRLIPRPSMPKWSVADLPRRESAQPENLSTGHIIADVVVSIMMLAWLMMIPSRPFLILGPGARILQGSSFSFTPEWHSFYWQIIALLALMLPLKALMLVPSMLRWRRHIQLAVNAVGIGVLAIVVNVRTFFYPSSTMLSAEQMARLGDINHGIVLAFQLVLAISVLRWLWDAIQLVRPASRNPQSTKYAAVK